MRCCSFKFLTFGFYLYNFSSVIYMKIAPEVGKLRRGTEIASWAADGYSCRSGTNYDKLRQRFNRTVPGTVQEKSA